MCGNWHAEKLSDNVLMMMVLVLFCVPGQKCDSQSVWGELLDSYHKLRTFVNIADTAYIEL